MATWIYVLGVVIATSCLASAQSNVTNDMFGNLPEGAYNASTTGANAGSLAHLFVMAKGFVDVVFKPFSELETFLDTSSIQTNGVDWNKLITNWQETLSFEAGYVACLVFGLLFFIFVPIVGSCMCCCRCCCNNCGGRLKQSPKRSKSCWRQCLCLSMFILTTFMAVPTIFVFLTNEWVTDVVTSTPAKTVAILNDAEEYLNIIPKQLTYITDQYTEVDDNVRPLVSDFGVSIGEPLKVKIEVEAQPALLSLNATIDVVNNVTKSVNDVDTAVAVLKNGTTTVDSSLAAVRTSLTSLNCGSPGSDLYCEAVKFSASQLTLGFDPADFDSLSSELDSVTSSLTSFDLDSLYANVTNEINNIPGKVRDDTKDASDSAVQALDDTKKQVDDISSQVPSFGNISDQVDGIGEAVTNAFEVYEPYDKYRYIAGCVLGSILAFVVACYYIGMVFGVCGSNGKDPADERGGVSNCGGIMIMVGVGFSFIFSWLLMLLVIVTFTVGGHGERYGCQPLEPPKYEAMALVENITNLDLANTLNLPEGVTLSFAEIMGSCENDASAYEAFKLEYVFNVTKFLGNVTDSLNDMNTTVSDSIKKIDFASIKIYSDADQQQLLDLKNSGLDSINFTDYLTKLGSGITNVDLTAFADTLENNATNITTPGSADIVKAQAAELRRIQKDEVDPLQTSYDMLQSSILVLQAQTSSLNKTIDDLDVSMIALNDSVTKDGEQMVTVIVNGVTDQIFGNISAYTDWIALQIETKLGACQPIYTVYTEFLGLFCNYLIDTVNGLWFSLGWCVFFLIPSAIVGMKLMKFFRRMEISEEYEDSSDYPIPLPRSNLPMYPDIRAWDDMEMRDYNSSPSGKPSAQYY